jgi:predicted HNH restriction endonuclease
MKKKAGTPRSRVRSCLRKLWMTSRERAATLRRDSYTCRVCGRKQSKAKGQEFDVQVHHVDGVGNWEQVIDLVYEELLCGPDKMIVVCKKCHQEVTDVR